MIGEIGVKLQIRMMTGYCSLNVLTESPVRLYQSSWRVRLSLSPRDSPDHTHHWQWHARLRAHTRQSSRYLWFTFTSSDRSHCIVPDLTQAFVSFLSLLNGGLVWVSYYVHGYKSDINYIDLDIPFVPHHDLMPYPSLTSKNIGNQSIYSPN